MEPNPKLNMTRRNVFSPKLPGDGFVFYGLIPMLDRRGVRSSDRSVVRPSDVCASGSLTRIRMALPRRWIDRAGWKDGGRLSTVGVWYVTLPPEKTHHD